MRYAGKVPKKEKLIIRIYCNLSVCCRFQHTWTKSAQHIHLMQSKSSIQHRLIPNIVLIVISLFALRPKSYQEAKNRLERRTGGKMWNCIKSPRKFAFILHCTHDKWAFWHLEEKKNTFFSLAAEWCRSNEARQVTTIRYHCHIISHHLIHICDMKEIMENCFFSHFHWMHLRCSYTNNHQSFYFFFFLLFLLHLLVLCVLSNHCILFMCIDRGWQTRSLCVSTVYTLVIQSIQWINAAVVISFLLFLFVSLLMYYVCLIYALQRPVILPYLMFSVCVCIYVCMLACK